MNSNIIIKLINILGHHSMKHSDSKCDCGVDHLALPHAVPFGADEMKDGVELLVCQTCGSKVESQDQIYGGCEDCKK